MSKDMNPEIAEQIADAWERDARRLRTMDEYHELHLDQRLKAGLVGLPEPREWATTQALDDDGMKRDGHVAILLLTDAAMIVIGVELSRDETWRIALSATSFRLDRLGWERLSRWIPWTQTVFQEVHELVLTVGPDRVAVVGYSRHEGGGEPNSPQEAALGGAIMELLAAA